VTDSATDEDLDWRGLAPATRRLWQVAGAGSLVVIGLLLTGVLTAVGGGAASLVVLVVFAGLAAFWAYLADRRWRAWGYAEREQDLVLRRGVLIRRLTIVPYGRMQFVDVRQGPLARTLGLASVKLHTAAAASDAEIPLVADDEARRLRDRLTALGESHAAGL
jgi:membrane protein YdbS with pleckstrin-like domain